MSHPSPSFTLTADGKDVTGNIAARLMSLTLTDNRGMDADTLEITLDDADGKCDLPPRGTVLRLALGWRGQVLVDKGSYTVGEVSHSGSPDTIRVQATAADLRGALTDKRDRSWHRTTVGAIVRKLASEHNLQPVLSDVIAGREVAHLDQTGESDLNLLTRLAQHHGAIATVKDGRLLMIKAGQATTASGKPLPELLIERKQGDQHTFTLADRDQASKVKATYQDTQSGKRGEVIYAGGKAKPKKAKSGDIDADTGNVVTLRHVYASKGNAERAAKSAWEKAQRGAASFSITLALGRPDVTPECPVRVSGWKPVIDNQPWLITKAVHSLGDGGLTTQIELEVLLDDGEN